jgi:rhodanese-related sulfurtransferase
MPVDSTGTVAIEKLPGLIDHDTFLVVCMLANNETGTVQDAAAISAVSHARNALFLCDCVQALGKIPVSVKGLGIDYATFSAHKIHGPKGVGALYVKTGVPIAPFLHGGHQETGMRAGTEGLHNIAGFAQAAKRLPGLLKKYSGKSPLKRSFINGLKSLIPDVTINTPPDNALPNTINATFPGIDNAMLIAVLDYYGIAVSAGSACSTPDNKASHVLTAIGLSDGQARTSVRFSMSDATSPRDMRYTLNTIRKFLGKKTPQVSVVAPAFLNESVLLSGQTYILDVRFWYDRVKIKSLPNAHEASFFSFGRYFRCLPRDKNIIVICQGGFYSPMIAFYCRRRGLRNVGFLTGGMEAWKAAQPELYKKYGGRDVVKLKPGGRDAILPH